MTYFVKVQQPYRKGWKFLTAKYSQTSDRRLRTSYATYEAAEIAADEYLKVWEASQAKVAYGRITGCLSEPTP